AIGRFSNPCLPSQGEECDCRHAGPDCNEFILGLPAPPLCPDGLNAPAEFARFVAGSAAAEMLEQPVAAALKFLDDFVYAAHGAKGGPDGAEESQKPEGDERRDFELWLRGLYTGSVDRHDRRRLRFEQLASGLLAWAADRCRFYLSLEQKRRPA